MIVAAHQPQYMPWLGYFAKIDQADSFVLLDTVQFKKNEWQNRNRIKTAQGPQWLTVPVQYKFPQKIFEVSINNTIRWQDKQRKTLTTNYSKAPFFDSVSQSLFPVFSEQWDTISALNIFVVKTLLKLVGITTPIHVASDFSSLPEGPDQRLIAITKELKGSSYLAGQGGKEYMNLDLYAQAGITIDFQLFEPPVYPQLFGTFEPYLSVLDLLFNCGPSQSLAIIRGENEYSGNRRSS